MLDASANQREVALATEARARAIPTGVFPRGSALDIESLRLFVGAADKLNITAAGREMGLSPAVASARIAKLEKTLGADLLRRSTRRVTLSLEGAELLPYAREIVAQADAARAVLGFGQATPTGTLRFAASSTFAQLYVMPLLPEFLGRYPDLDLDLRLSDGVFDLIEGSFDLALRNGVLEDSSLKGRKLADDRRVLCASPAYLERRGRPVLPAELGGHDLVAFRDQAPRRLSGRDETEAWFDPRDGRRRVVIDDGASMRLASVAGVGISLNSIWSVHADLEAGRLERVLPDFEVEDRSALWLVYPKSNVLTLKVRVFIDFLMERIGATPPWQGAVRDSQPE